MPTQLPRERPEFIITGVRLPDDTVMILASINVPKITIESETEAEVEWDRFGPYLTPGYRRTWITADIPTYTIIKAKTYAEAFVTLMKTWNPDDQRSKIVDWELESGSTGGRWELER